MNTQYPATQGWSTLSFNLSLAVAILVSLAVTAVFAPVLQRRLRSDLLPWLAGGSFLVALVLVLVACLHLTPVIQFR